MAKIYENGKLIYKARRQDYEDTRVCGCCGCQFSEGMTDLWDFYCCEDCFQELRDQGDYTLTEDDGEDGYYFDKDGNGTGIFYTEWY